MSLIIHISTSSFPVTTDDRQQLVVQVGDHLAPVQDTHVFFMWILLVRRKRNVLWEIEESRVTLTQQGYERALTDLEVEDMVHARTDYTFSNPSWVAHTPLPLIEVEVFVTKGPLIFP